MIDWVLNVPFEYFFFFFSGNHFYGSFKTFKTINFGHIHFGHIAFPILDNGKNNLICFFIFLSKAKGTYISNIRVCVNTRVAVKIIVGDNLATVDYI